MITVIAHQAIIKPGDHYDYYYYRVSFINVFERRLLRDEIFPPSPFSSSFHLWEFSAQFFLHAYFTLHIFTFKDIEEALPDQVPKLGMMTRFALNLVVRWTNLQFFVQFRLFCLLSKNEMRTFFFGKLNKEVRFFHFLGQSCPFKTVQFLGT